MRMADFIRTNLDPIIEQWIAFAKTILSASKMDKTALRDHAKEMLVLIADDLDTPQTNREQADKSKGLDGPDAEAKAFQQHGYGRFASGFSIEETVSEFRALRASVIHLWTAETPTRRQPDFIDLTRFNEAIDQAIAESITSYAAEKELQGRLLETVLSASPDQISIFSSDGTYMYVNNAAAQLYDRPADTIIGNKCSEIGFPFANVVQLHLEHVTTTGEQYRDEVTYETPCGTSKWFEYILTPVSSAQATDAIVSIGRDITKRKAAEEESWKNANFDTLTGLPNRRQFYMRLKQAMATPLDDKVPTALLLIDLDRFKEVNDLLGHHAGDNLLCQAAARIASCAHPDDTVARLGGDEFAVLLVHTTGREAVKVIAQNIVTELANPFQLDHEIAYISGSVGITLFPNDALEPQNMVRNADQAMYAAKRSGRNQISFFTQRTQTTALARLKLIAELRDALEKGQMEVYFQPIVDLSTSQITKAEALVRWRHPSGDLILPGEFIGIAEETGLIHDIGDFVFKEAAKWSKHWGAAHGRPFQISINKSPVQFIFPLKGINWIAHLDEIGLDGHCITIEITEGVLLEMGKGVGDKLDELQKGGVEVSIDDFGTGYSSLSYLKKFDVDYLKIDQSFVRDMLQDPSTETIVETIIIMANKLGLKVIAEGVETAKQNDWLKAHGCHYAQGFYFSEPVPAAAFDHLLALNR